MGDTMRALFGHRSAAMFFSLAAIVAIGLSGCSTSTRSGLPVHINTVEVHIFQNKTMYKSLEGLITRGIIDRINADPHVRLVSSNGDALITGEITNVQRSTLRETTTNQPGTVLITIEVTFSFYDNIQGVYLLDDVTITSTDTGQGDGIYEASRGRTSFDGEQGAVNALAAEIVRRTVGMW